MFIENKQRVWQAEIGHLIIRTFLCPLVPTHLLLIYIPLVKTSKTEIKHWGTFEVLSPGKLPQVLEKDFSQQVENVPVPIGTGSGV